MAVGTDLGISYGSDLALNTMNDLDLKGWLTYHYAYFQQVNCLDTEDLDDSGINQAKLSYFCPKYNLEDCGNFRHLGHFQCFLVAEERGFASHHYLQQCVNIESSAQIGCLDAHVQSTKTWGVNLANFGYTIDQCSRIQTVPQGLVAMSIFDNLDRIGSSWGQLDFIVDQVMRIRTRYQAEVAIKALRQWRPRYAIDQAMRIRSRDQARIAIEMMDHWNPRYAVDHALENPLYRMNTANSSNRQSQNRPPENHSTTENTSTQEEKHYRKLTLEQKEKKRIERKNKSIWEQKRKLRREQ